MSEKPATLESLAPILDGLKARPDAKVSFELMSGALIWGDEFPNPSDGAYQSVGATGTWPLRVVWGFRASLIREAPRENLRASWDKAVRLFPNWPGFLPERRDPKWRDFLDQENARTSNAFEDLDERWRRQQDPPGDGVSKSARLVWLPPSQGGRQFPPTGPSYSTVAQFDGAVEPWSLVVEMLSRSSDSMEWIATVRFLFPEAPSELLRDGATFELMEGKQRVAIGTVGSVVEQETCG